MTTHNCPFCHEAECPGSLGSPKYENQDFDACQDYHYRPWPETSAPTRTCDDDWNDY
jgi:hypothetical protein